MDSKLQRLLNGERVIVGEEWLDNMADVEEARRLHTAYNRNRLGVHDQYVAWIGDANKPADLEFVPDRQKGQIAIASL